MAHRRFYSLTCGVLQVQGFRLTKAPMDIAKYLSLPLRYKPWRPRHARLILADITRPAAEAQQSHAVHLAGAIDWLCRAQDVRNDQPDAGGVSAGWSFEDGWLPSYPETTGYIIETMLAAAKVLDRPDLVGPRAPHDRLGAVAAAARRRLSWAFRRARLPSGDLQSGTDSARHGGRPHPAWPPRLPGGSRARRSLDGRPAGRQTAVGASSSTMACPTSTIPAPPGPCWPPA